MPPGCREKGPKLYLVVARGKTIYVGITKQPLRARLRYGWTADGKHGYHGYAWRKTVRDVIVFVWSHPKKSKAAEVEMETIEAEVVHLIRAEGQWPAFQTEIHFHVSKARHREAAREVLRFVRHSRRRK
ncbi:MAG: GIY-YIG nuclease family protein [Planctomycetia bacterium]|nr:GIY-YIG nuclease family protein [Planctomycetia bacterium]